MIEVCRLDLGETSHVFFVDAAPYNHRLVRVVTSAKGVPTGTDIIHNGPRPVSRVAAEWCQARGLPCPPAPAFDDYAILGGEGMPEYPFVERKQVWGREVATRMANPVSESWYGLKGAMHNFGLTEGAAREWWDAWNPPLRSLCREGMTAIDAGANQGFITSVLALAAGPTGRAYGVEPVPANVRVARENIELNRLRGHSARGHADVALAALSDGTEEQVRMTGETVTENGEAVRAISLDDYLLAATNNGGALIKVDVEGYEVKVLRGGRRLLSLPETRLEIEVHLFGPDGPDMRKYGTEPKEMWDLLAAAGLKVFRPGAGFAHDNPVWERLASHEQITVGTIYAFRD